MGVSIWCISHEMDGPWQVCRMSPEEYASAADWTAQTMKLAEPGLELVIRSSSSACVPTFGKWESTVLTKAYENVDSVFCHAYCYERGVASQQEADLKVHQSLGTKPWPKASPLLAYRPWVP